MSAVVVQAFVTLDGVVQGGGDPDEDREGGFGLGGWALGYDREHDAAGEIDAVVTEWESRTEALLLGRKTYDIWARAWAVWPEDAPGQMGELTRRYNRVPKYVASRTVGEFGWKNSHHLGADLPAAVAGLATDRPGEIRVWGSTEVIRSLAEHDLIDEYRLAVYPIVLGTGKRLFPSGFPAGKFALAGSRALGSGVVVSTLRRAR